MSLRSINCFQQGNTPCSSFQLLRKLLLCIQMTLIECSCKPSCNQNFTCARCKQSFGQCHCRGTSVETSCAVPTLDLYEQLNVTTVNTHRISACKQLFHEIRPSNFSAALADDDRLTPGPDSTSTLHVVTIDIAPKE